MPQLPDNIEELKALLTAQFVTVDALKTERHAFQLEAQLLRISLNVTGDFRKA